MRKPWLQVPRTELSKVEAQERMYALADKSDELYKQIEGLSNLLDGIYDEKLSLFKGHPTLLFIREE